MYRDKDHPIKGAWVIGDYEFDRCPAIYVEPEFYQWITAYNYYRRGHFPTLGGWMDQARKYIDMMALIDCEVEKHGRK